MSENKDLIGRKFGELFVLTESKERLRNEIAFICTCNCGNKALATKGQLLSGRKKSCGCLRKKSPVNAIDITGLKFGMLTTIERDGNNKNGSALWKCKCDCGKLTTANFTSLRNGDTVSCGCLKTDRINNARKVLMEDKTFEGVQIPLLTKQVRVDSKTGIKGVHKRIRNGKEYYEVNITIKGIRKYVGTFSNIDSAKQARISAEKQYHDPYIKALEDSKNEQ